VHEPATTPGADGYRSGLEGGIGVRHLLEFKRRRRAAAVSRPSARQAPLGIPVCERGLSLATAGPTPGARQRRATRTDLAQAEYPMAEHQGGEDKERRDR